MQNNNLPSWLLLAGKAMTQPRNVAFFIFSIVGLVFVMQWTFALDQLIGVMRFAPQALPRYLLEGSFNFYVYIFDVIPAFILLSSGLVALNLTIARQLGCIKAFCIRLVLFYIGYYFLIAISEQPISRLLSSYLDPGSPVVTISLRVSLFVAIALASFIVLHLLKAKQAV